MFTFSLFTASCMLKSRTKNNKNRIAGADGVKIAQHRAEPTEEVPNGTVGYWLQR